jgi:hypothetical protein
VSLEKLIDRVVADSAADTEDLLAARAEWDERSGKVHDDDPLYEERSTAFVEWFALERPGKDGLAPVERLLARLPATDEDREGLRLLSHTHRSLFAVRRVRAPHVELEDLLTNCMFRVYERRQPLGLNEGDVFEARLCARADASGDVLLTRAIQHHPPAARLALEARRDESRTATLFRLARLRWKAARWGHVPAERIYQEGEPEDGHEGGPESDAGETPREGK